MRIRRQSGGNLLLGTLIGTLVMGPSTHAQGPEKLRKEAGVKQEEQAREAAQKEAIAESIIAREEAAGRPFDPAFRARIKADLGRKSLEQLAEVQERGKGLLPGPYSLGDSQKDLVYTPLTPCRIIDTRNAGGKMIAGTTRNFRVTGTNFSGQGGSSGDCGVPVGPATAAMINFVAVSPDGPGNLRITPFGTAMPTASFLNYAAIGLNVANGMAFAICDPATATCTNDFTISANVNGTQVVADVLGYFRNPTPPVEMCTVCFTCGGNWPYLEGVLPTASGANERPAACDGEVAPSSDLVPWLCCR